MNGKPFQLVYSRNGSPQTTIDHEGFRRFLQRRYGDISKLNADWGTSFASFNDITMDFSATGHQRAFSIFYQAEDLYAPIQALRQLNVPFDLIPEDFVTDAELSKFRVVIAPAGSVGFGYNAQNERISDVLFRWAQNKGGQRRPPRQRAGRDAPPLLVTPEGQPVPCQVEGNTLWFSALVPPQGSQILHLSSGAAPKTDLVVTKKGGVVTVENSRYLIAFDESRSS
jgi:hypothetical protein